MEDAFYSGFKVNKQAAWMNETPTVIVNMQSQPGANTISVVKAVKRIQWLYRW
jgi:multidrug efflux pump